MKKASFLFLGALSLVLALEILLHLVPPPRYASNWIYDKVLGHRGPRTELVYLDGLNVRSQYNSYGFRGEDPTPRSVRPDQFSVFIFGDSITEAVQVPWRRAYPKRLEYLLNDKLARDSEVTSWAISDYGTANELLLFSREAAALDPNVILIQFLGLNDFVNNGFGFAGENKALSDFARPYLIPQSMHGKVPEYTPFDNELKFTYLNPRWKSLREASRILTYLDFFSMLKVWKQKRASAEIPAIDSCAPEVEVFLDEPSKRWKDSFEVTQRLAAAFKAKVSALPRKPLLLAFYAPSYFEVFEPAWKHGLELSLLRCFPGSYHRENPEKKFLELFRAAGVEAVSLKDDFLKSPLPITQLYLPDGHYSSEGHRLVAEALAQHIAARARASSRQH